MNDSGNNEGPQLNASIDEKLFALLIESVDEYAIFMVDTHGIIMTWNSGAEHIKGYTEDEIIGKSISVFYTEEDNRKKIPQRNLAEALKRGKYESEGWRLRKDGSRFWANIVFTPIYDSNHILLGFAKITRDITERKEIENQRARLNIELASKVKENTEKIISNELKFRKLIENSYDGISLLDKDFNTFYRSHSAERINGYSNTERSDYHLIELVHPDDQQSVREILQEVIKNPGKPILTVFRTRHKLGHYIWLESVFTNMLLNPNIDAIICNFRDVTERKKYEEELKRRNEQIENILERITDGFIALDERFCYTYANKKIGEMTGHDPQWLIGKYVWDVFPDAIGSDTYLAFEKAFREQQYVFNEDHYKPLNIWQENYIYPSPQGLSVFVRDTTLHKRAEKQIKEGQLQLLEAAETQAAILNALPPNIALLNIHGKIIAINESWKKFALQNNLGLPNYGVGYNYLAVCEKAMGIDETDGAMIAKGIREVMQGRLKEFKTEYACHSPYEQRWFQLIVAPLADKKHKGVVTLHINITDRKLAEESLIRSETNLRTIFENAELSIVLFDNDLNIISFNSNAALLAVRNFNKKLKTGQSIFKYFPKERRNVVRQSINRALNSREPVLYETFYLFNDLIEWYEVRWAGIFNGESENIGVILTFKDITERKQYEKERSKMTADLVKRNHDLEQFAYIVSHNLRAPVANIIGLSNLMGHAEMPQMDSRETLHALSASAKNLDKVVIDLNHILQLNNQRTEKSEWIILTNLTEEIQSDLAEIISKNKASVICDFSAINKLYTLKSYLYSIFHNLLTNSIKYKKQGRAPVIHFSSRIEKNMVSILFRDNGRGMDLPKISEHLFGLYKRFDTSVEGKGMGLFMVKTQVESLGGTVSVKSIVNEGTEFCIELPVQ